MLGKLINIIDYSNKLKVRNFFRRKFKKNFLNIIDIGAHEGETINFFLNDFNINKIFVFEPNKKLYEILIKLFKGDNIFIFN